jgi:hypothetical protein
MKTAAVFSSLTVVGFIAFAFVPSAHAALWEYRFTGTFVPVSPQVAGVGSGVFAGIDGANPQGASFTMSVLFHDTVSAYQGNQWNGTMFEQEYVQFNVTDATITRGAATVNFGGTIEVDRRVGYVASFNFYAWPPGGLWHNVYSAAPLPPLQLQPNFPLAEYANGIGWGIQAYGATEPILRYEFSDASLTIVPAPSAASLLALVGLTTRGRRRK